LARDDRKCEIRNCDNIKIHKVETTSFAITLCGHCCRCHVVGQQVVSDVNIVRSCWSIFGLYSECNNTNLLPRLLIAVLEKSIVLHTPNILCPTTWPRIGLLGDHRQRIYWRHCTLSIARWKMQGWNAIQPTLFSLSFSSLALLVSATWQSGVANI